MNEILDRIKKNREEFDSCIRQLEMWEKVKQQGINPEDVQSFTFDPTLVSFTETRRLRRNAVYGNGAFWTPTNPYHWPMVEDAEGCRRIKPYKFNIVILKNGERKQLNPVIDAP